MLAFLTGVAALSLNGLRVVLNGFIVALNASDTFDRVTDLVVFPASSFTESPLDAECTAVALSNVNNTTGVIMITALTLITLT